MVASRTSKRRTSKRRPVRAMGFYVEYARPGYIGVRVEKIAPASILDAHPGTAYRKELNKLVRRFRKKHGKIKVTDVVFSTGRPSWGHHKLLKKTPKNEAIVEKRHALTRRKTSKHARRIGKRRISRNGGRWEWGVHGRNMGARPDPFSHMTKDELLDLHKIYSSEGAAEAMARKLQGKYGPDIMFSVKGRQVGSGGTGISRAYAAPEVLRSMPRPPRRRSSKRRSSKGKMSRRRTSRRR